MRGPRTCEHIKYLGLY